MSEPSTSRAGRWVAVAAILVTAPRIALAFLAGDGIQVAPATRIALLGVSSVATAIALTGGAAYLAAALARSRGRRGGLALLWAATLVCSCVLIAPAIVAGLPGSPLAGVLSSDGPRWAWALAASLGVDLVAAGAMLAGATGRRAAEGEDEKDAAHRRALDELERQRDEARAEVAAARRAVRAQPPERVQPVGPSPPAAPPSLAAGPELFCPNCGRSDFVSRKALGAHSRWCTPRPA